MPMLFDKKVFEGKNKKVIIESVYVDGQKLKADIIDDGQKKELWFCYSDNYQPVALNADAFLIYILRYAMIHNKDIVSKVPVHYELLNSINRLLIPAIHLADPGRAKMTVSAPVLAEYDCHQAPGVITGFSCGVDSFYALLNHYRTGDRNLDVTHVFFFDFFSQNINNQWNAFTIAKNVAAEMGFSIIKMCTNVLNVLNLNWYPTHLYSLFAAVNSMQDIVGKHYLSSSFYVTDVNMNNPLFVDPAHYELLLIKAFHHKDMETYIEGPVARIDKTDFIADFPIVQNHLSVCWPRVDDNCGICSKCVRTLVDLDVCGKLDKFATVFDIADYKEKRDWYLSFARTEHDYGNEFFQDSVGRFKARGEEITETFEDKMAKIIEPQAEKIIQYFEQKNLKSVLFFGRRYEKFVDQIADILSKHGVKVYVYTRDRNPNLLAVARERVEFINPEQLSSDMAKGIDAMILMSMTMNLTIYNWLFDRMKRSRKSSVHLSEVIDIPFFRGKAIEVELNKNV